MVKISALGPFCVDVDKKGIKGGSVCLFGRTKQYILCRFQGVHELKIPISPYNEDIFSPSYKGHKGTQ